MSTTRLAEFVDADSRGAREEGASGNAESERGEFEGVPATGTDAKAASSANFASERDW